MTGVQTCALPICGSAQRTAIAKVTAVDYAGNSATGTCSGSVTVPSCCSSLQSGGQWYSSSCSKSCGGGTKNNYQLSALNGGQCNAYSSSCNTQSCCSSNNPYGCQWVTACREGQTWVYSDSGLSTYYAVVWHHTSGHQEDKMYILNHYGRGVYVYAPHMDKWGMSYTNYVYIYANCINQPAYYNSVCPYNSCPG